MNLSQVLTDTNNKFDTAVERFMHDLKSLRTGRANSAMLDGMVVEVYGSLMPLNQVSTITAPEAQLLQITPFDPNNLQAIVTAIRNNSALGLNPSDDGRVVRVPVPPLTEERRRDIAKQIGEKTEECLVRMRSIRHDAFDVIGQAKKDKMIGEDEAKRFEKSVDESLASHRQTVDSAAKAKEQEIMTL